MPRMRLLGSQLAIQGGLVSMLDLVLWVATLVRGDHWIGIGARTVGAGLVATAVALGAGTIAAAPASFYRPVYRSLRRATGRPWAGGYAVLVAAALIVGLGNWFATGLWDDVSRLVANPLPGCDASHPVCDYDGVKRLTLTIMAYEAFLLLDIAVLLACAGTAVWRGEVRRLRRIRLRARIGVTAGRA